MVLRNVSILRGVCAVDQGTVSRPFERDLEVPPYRIFVINEQDSCHRSSHPFPRLLANYGTRSGLFFNVTGKGQLLAEWPGERATDRLQSPWR